MSLTLNPSSGGETLATHVTAGEHHQVIKMATGGSDEAFPVSVANPLPTQHAPPLFWRVGFAESGAGLQGLAAAEMTLIQTGAGMTVNQTGGNLVITTGTTVNSETVLRSNLAFKGALLARYKAILSQRISNQTFRFELAELRGDDAEHDRREYGDDDIAGENDHYQPGAERRLLQLAPGGLRFRAPRPGCLR